MKNEVFDQTIYDRFEDSIWSFEYSFKDAIEQLKKKGFPTTLEFVQKITKDDDSFRDYINDLQRQRLSGGFVPKGEREMVHQAFADLYSRLEKKISALRSSLNSGLILKQEGDTVAIDQKATEEVRKQKSTIQIDTKLGLEYYSKFIAVVDAHKQLREYEKANQLPESIKLQFFELTTFGWTLNQKGTITEDDFAHGLRYWLQKK